MLMKKLMLLFFAIIFVTTSASAASSIKFKVGDLYYIGNNDNGTATVTYEGWYYDDFSGYYFYTYYSNLPHDIVIPETVTYNDVTYTVTGIGDNAFWMNSNSIDAGTLYIESVNIPTSVTWIGNNAFTYTQSNVSIRISSIESWLNIDIQDDLTFCEGYRLFLNGSEIESLLIPNSITEVKNYAFKDCKSLTTVEIHNSVTSIGKRAFAGCTSLTSIYSKIKEPQNVTYGYNIFYDVNKNTCVLYVPKGTKDLYLATSPWSEFVNIEEVEYNDDEYSCDVDGDGTVTAGDLTVLYNFLLNNDSSALVNGDIDGDGAITAADITIIYNYLLGNQ